MSPKKEILYKRQKLLLFLMMDFLRDLTAIELQKYLFLVSKETSIQLYDFIPYKYGPVSFQSYQDISFLQGKNYIEKYDYHFKAKGKSIERRQEINEDFLGEIRDFLGDFKNMNQQTLKDYVYKNYPEYTTYDEIIKGKYKSDNANIKQIFSIGYEGKSIDTYLQEMLDNNIKFLIDVRRNPVSRKYGFSQRTLKNLVEKMGMKYYHMPQLGIDSYMRRDLNGYEDYQCLFKTYHHRILQSNLKDIEEVLSLSNKYKRVALTCFEKDYHYCHRSIICNVLEDVYNVGDIIHI